MSSWAWLETDLLRQRREVFGEQRPTIVPVRTLLVKGALFGASLPLVVLILFIWFWWTQIRLTKEVKLLEPIGRNYDRIARSISTEKSALKAILATNKAVASAIVDVRSSSALLEELRQLVPVTVGFEQAKISGNILEIKGNAVQPDGLRSINALMLSLGRSGLFDDENIELVKAQSVFPSKPAGDSSVLNYSVKASFSPKAALAIRPRLTELGAVGLAERVRRIQEEADLLP